MFIADNSKTPCSIEPTEIITRWALIQILRWNILRFNTDTLPAISLFIIKHHPETQGDREQNTGTPKRRSRDQGGSVFGGILVAEDVGSNDSHKVGDGNGDTGEYDASALVCDVVVVP